MATERTPLLEEVGDSLAVPEHFAPGGADSAHDVNPSDVLDAADPEHAQELKPSVSFFAMVWIDLPYNICEAVRPQGHSQPD
jgi:hypothetical protein